MPEACDVAVIGGGAAGLHVALTAAEAGAAVTLVSRKPLAESSSFWAQGGLAAALASDDSPELHAEDTLAAGRDACRTAAVEILTAEAPAAVRRLEEQGVAFDRDENGELSLGLEGGHSRRRVIHAGGASTGRRITERLAELAAAEPGIEVLEGCSALALWSGGSGCAGVISDRGPLRARATVLATGGAAALWSRTTNPWGAIGAGPVLAHAAGARLADLEFCQFHPTALAKPGSKHDGMLVTEAVRGEGGTLLDAAGERFTDELAPRDEVTIAILARIDEEGSDHVLLDMRSVPPERFPNIFEALREAGFDATTTPIPVAPAAHYTMGGIATDLDGHSSLPGLFAVGECSCTGLHGANRLASNSLSECFVFGTRAALAAIEEAGTEGDPEEPTWRFDPPEAETREAVWRCAGPVRDEHSLRFLLAEEYPLARLLARSALQREESRGPHRRSDHPKLDPELDRVHFVHDPSGELSSEHWD